MIFNTHYAYGAGVSRAVSVSISGNLKPSGYYCCVIINDVTYGNTYNNIKNFPANITITPGTDIVAAMRGSSETPSSCYVNGKKVINANSSTPHFYEFIPTGKCTIVMNSFTGGNNMTITY